MAGKNPTKFSELGFRTVGTVYIMLLIYLAISKLTSENFKS